MFISSGLFVPSLLIGASWGRLTGMFLVAAFPSWDWGDLGKYALIGASAQLAGTIRLTYSLTAIILEATGNLTYIFPVFVTVLIAKIVGDFINEGTYLNSWNLYLKYFFLSLLVEHLGTVAICLNQL
jgi:chloride channel 7